MRQSRLLLLAYYALFIIPRRPEHDLPSVAFPLLRPSAAGTAVAVCEALCPSAGASGTTVEHVESATDAIDLASSLFQVLGFPMLCGRRSY